MGYSHWDFFLDVERSFKEHTEAIGYTSNYYAVRSPELAEIILTCGSTFLTTAGFLCKAIDPEPRPTTMAGFYPIITAHFPKFTEYKVVLPSYNMALQPWKDWTAASAPDWWTGYERLARDSEANFKHATYWNALYATAGLLCGILYYHRVQFGKACMVDSRQAPKIFFPKHYGPPNQQRPGWCFTTPDD